jgi:DNA-binding MarR family transcriptional regulator
VLAPDRADHLLAEISELYSMVLLIAGRVHDGERPMTATQRLALIEIASDGPLRLRELSRRIETTPATATRAVDALQQWDLVRRQPDPLDGRGVLVAATARGARWATRRGMVVRDALALIPSSAAPTRLLQDLARLNGALRVATGHEDPSRRAFAAGTRPSARR